MTHIIHRWHLQFAARCLNFLVTVAVLIYSLYKRRGFRVGSYFKFWNVTHPIQICTLVCDVTYQYVMTLQFAACRLKMCHITMCHINVSCHDTSICCMSTQNVTHHNVSYQCVMSWHFNLLHVDSECVTSQFNSICGMPTQNVSRHATIWRHVDSSSSSRSQYSFIASSTDVVAGRCQFHMCDVTHPIHMCDMTHIIHVWHNHSAVWCLEFLVTVVVLIYRLLKRRGLGRCLVYT